MRIFLFVLCLLGFLSLPGQRDTTYFELDTLQTSVRTFDESQIENYKRESRFNFTQDPTYETNYIRKFLSKISKWLSSHLGAGVSKFLFYLLFYGLIFLGVGFLLYHFIKTENGGMFEKEDKKKTVITAETVDETTDRKQIEKLIQAAISAGDYRVAVRLLYLKTLRALDDSELIQWKTGKTNSDYIMELSNSNLKEQFQEATRIYEYVWYGEFELESQDEFKSIHQQFNDLSTKISKDVG